MDLEDEQLNYSTVDSNQSIISKFDIYAMDIEIINDDATIRFDNSHDDLHEKNETMMKLNLQNTQNVVSNYNINNNESLDENLDFEEVDFDGLLINDQTDIPEEITDSPNQENNKINDNSSQVTNYNDVFNLSYLMNSSHAKSVDGLLFPECHSDNQKVIFYEEVLELQNKENDNSDIQIRSPNDDEISTLSPIKNLIYEYEDVNPDNEAEVLDSDTESVMIKSICISEENINLSNQENNVNQMKLVDYSISESETSINTSKSYTHSSLVAKHTSFSKDSNITHTTSKRKRADSFIDDNESDGSNYVPDDDTSDDTYDDTSISETSSEKSPPKKKKAVNKEMSITNAVNSDPKAQSSKQVKLVETNKKSSLEGSKIPSTVFEMAATIPTNITKPRSMTVEQIIPFSNEGPKRNCCPFCFILFPRLDRHLVSKHKDEEAVKVLQLLQDKDARREQLKMLRALGNDRFNNDRTLNPDGIILCARRQRVKKNTESSDAEQQFEDGEETVTHTSSKTANEDKNTKKSILPARMPCPKCLVYLSSKNLRNHKCGRDSSTKLFSNKREVIANSKKIMGLCRPEASQLVRDNILPKLRLDKLGILARQDLLIILYANKFAIRYSDVDQQAYVRGHMRLLAKLKLAIIEKNGNIQDLCEVFRPMCWGMVLEAINDVSKHDSESQKYAIIYNAETLPLLIRKCIKILKREYIIQENRTNLQLVTDFEKVFENDVEFSVSYLAALSRKEAGRHQDPIKLPTSDDILTFENFLKFKRDLSLQHFDHDGREFEHYLNILQTTAILILLYNRRRVGEIGKTLLMDFLHAKKTEPSTEFFKMLPVSEQKQCLKYKRIDIQGKRADGKGALFVSADNERCLELIIKYRSLYKINDKNIYLFALPEGEDQKPRHIKVCELMTKLSYECSVTYQEIDDNSIRGTLLRKQLATYNSAISDESTTKLMHNHMGHSENVHDSNYKYITPIQQNKITHTLDRINRVANINLFSDENIQNSTVEQDEIFKSVDTVTLNHDSVTTSTDKNDKENSNSDCNDEDNESVNHNTQTYSKFTGIQRAKKNKKSKEKKVLKRKAWSSEELAAFHDAFEKQLRSRSYASNKEMQEAKKKYPILQNRSESIIRAKFWNIYKKLD